MSDQQTADSYYQRNRVAAPARPVLQGEIETDVCIVGGGLAGLSCALELLRRGRQVVLIEAHEVAWGASGRNGGFVLGGYAQGLDALEQKLGLAQARALFELSLEGVDMVRDNIQQLQLADCQPTSGELSLRRHDAGDELLWQRDHMAAHYDYAVEVLPREAVRELLDSDRYHQAIRDEHGFHFHPLNYCLGLAAEIERLGGQIFEHSAMQQLDRKGAAQRVKTAEGTLLAREVVLCGGGYAGRMFPKLHRSYLPISTYVIVTEALGERLQQIIRTSEALMDDRRAGNYYRIVDGHIPGGARLLWGGHITARTADPADLAQRMKRDLVSVFPQLADVRVEMAWSGLMAYARHQMPLIGPLAEGQWLCTAFGGHGMNTAPLGGRLVAEGICGDSDRHRLFEPFGLQWNGGPFGPLAAEAIYAGLRLQDWWRERG